MSLLAVGMLVFTLASNWFSSSSYIPKGAYWKMNFFKPVIDSLLVEKADSAFINMLLSDPETHFDEKCVRINVIGYLQKPNYSKQTTLRAAINAYEFISKYKELFRRTDSIFGVSKEYIAAIISIETKFGKNTGDYKLPTVFFSAAMASQINFIQKNKFELKRIFKGDEYEFDSLLKKIDERSLKKSKWALKEILALQKMYKERNLDILALKGSWAGAFGLPQFLPSSYMNWAVDGNGDGEIDLFDVNDAVPSVGNYLKNNGWGYKLSEKRSAIFNYNNSHDYVDAVLRLASKIRNLDSAKVGDDSD